MSTAKEETPEQIAARVVRESGLRLYGKRRQKAEDQVSFALRGERARAVRLIDEHRAMDVCNDNCWTAIKAAIRGRTE